MAIIYDDTSTSPSTRTICDAITHRLSVFYGDYYQKTHNSNSADDHNLGIITVVPRDGRGEAFWALGFVWDVNRLEFQEKHITSRIDQSSAVRLVMQPSPSQSNVSQNEDTLHSLLSGFFPFVF